MQVNSADRNIFEHFSLNEKNLSKLFLFDFLSYFKMTDDWETKKIFKEQFLAAWSSFQKS